MEKKEIISEIESLLQKLNGPQAKFHIVTKGTTCEATFIFEMSDGSTQPDKPAGRWKPKDREFYYFVTEYGVIARHSWSNGVWGNHRYRMRNCFRTKEEAQRKLDRDNLIADIWDYADEVNGDWKPDWENFNWGKWHVSYDHEIKKWKASSVYIIEIYDAPLFKEERFCSSCIEKFKDRLHLLL